MMEQLKELISNDAAGLHHAPPPRFLEYRIEEFSKKFSNLGASAPSQITEIEDFRWRIVVKVDALSGDKNIPIINEPRKRKIDDEKKYVGIYLKCQTKLPKPTWSINVIGHIILCAQVNDKEDYVRDFRCTFNASCTDYRVDQFITWDKVIDPEFGFLRNDTIVVQVQFPMNPINMASGIFHKQNRPTEQPAICNTLVPCAGENIASSQAHVKTSTCTSDFVGLKNLEKDSSVSLINSMVQVLFLTNMFRKTVYSIPTEKISSEGSAILTLQLLFHDLQTSREAVEARVTDSFGPREALRSIFHNVPEFFRLVLCKLESELKNIGFENIISKLFVGEMEFVLKCHAIDGEAKLCQPFYDLELEVVNKNDIYDAFDDFVKDSSGEHLKSRLVEKFPPVLFIHLKRFVQNPTAGTLVRCNNRFKFYKNIVLDKYLKNKGKKWTTYTLHAVLVHSNEKFLDHFTVFIDPENKGEWYKFDDDVVLKCTKREAIEMNYGGEVEGETNGANAFMLVYIRDSEVKNILQDVTNNDIPSELEARVREEKEKEKIRLQEIAQSQFHKFVSVNVYLEEAFVGHEGFDLFDSNVQAPSKTYRIKETSLLKDVVTLISATFGCPLEHIRTWPMISRPNKTYRPVYIDMKANMSKKLSKIFKKEPWRFFLETSVTPFPPFQYGNEVLVFFKLYDPQNMKISYCGHQYLRLDSSINDLIKLLKEKASYPSSTEIEIYEEVDTERFEKLTASDEPLNKVLKEISNGDIFILQKKAPEFPNVIDYLKKSTKKVEIVFENLDSPNEPGVTVELPGIVHENILTAASKKANIVQNEVDFLHCKIKYRKSK